MVHYENDIIKTGWLTKRELKTYDKYTVTSIKAHRLSFNNVSVYIGTYYKCHIIYLLCYISVSKHLLLYIDHRSNE